MAENNQDQNSRMNEEDRKAVGTCKWSNSPHVNHPAGECTNWQPLSEQAALAWERSRVAPPAAPEPSRENVRIGPTLSVRRWMKLPANSDYPDFVELHLENDWCPQGGCVSASLCEVG